MAVGVKEMLIFAVFTSIVSLTFSASLNGTVSIDVDTGLEKSSSQIALFFMNDNCDKTIKLYTRRAIRVAPWSTKYPPARVNCHVLVEERKYSNYKFVITFKKMEMSSATPAGPCVNSRLDMYRANSESPSTRISESDGICGNKADSEEYTTSGDVLNLVYTTNSLIKPRSYEYFEAVITPYHKGTCKHDEFKCKNERCIKNDMLCNGYNNCGDDSDEKSCAALLLSVAAIVGIVVGCVILVGCICSIVICKCCCGACGYERI